MHTDSNRKSFSFRFRAYFQLLRCFDFLQTLLIVFPCSVLFFFAQRYMDMACGPIAELRPRKQLLFVAAWCAAGILTSIITRVLRLLSIQLRPVLGAVLMVILFFPLDTIGIALAEDWTLAILKANGAEARFSGTGADWNSLYSEIHTLRNGLKGLCASDFLYSIEGAVFLAPIWLPIILLCGWMIRRGIKSDTDSKIAV